MSKSDSQLRREVLEQPSVLRQLLEVESQNIERIAELLRERTLRQIVIAARGSSDNAARYGKYLFGASLGLPVALATPSLLTIYKKSLNLGEDCLVLGISQSGQSPDIVAVLEEGVRNEAITVAITNDLASPLARAARHAVNLHVGQERSVPATKTYTASLMVLAMLCFALARDGQAYDELEKIPGFIASVLSSAEDVIQQTERYRYMDACAVISRGYNYATAFEIALKLKEMAYVLAEPYSSADFRHGPAALLVDGFPVIAIVPEGNGASEPIALLRELKTQNAELIVISALDEALALAYTALHLPPGIPEWLSPMVAVVPGQLFSLGLTQAKGFDPDNPRGLRKITMTL